MNGLSQAVSRVRGSDGKLLDTWTGATNAQAVVIAMGRVFVTGDNSPKGSLYMIDPAAPIRSWMASAEICSRFK